MDIANKELKAVATAAVASIQAGQFEQALPQIDVLLEKRTELTPEDVAALLYMKGFSLYKLQREAEAEPLLTESTQLNPKVEPTFELLSVVLVHQKKWDEAIAAIRADLDLTPDDPNRRFTKMVNLGLALREADRIASP